MYGQHKYLVTGNKESRTWRGIVFDSRLEMRRYIELRDMERRGTIETLERQRKFVLQESFVDNTGKRQKEIAYICDFFYYDKGRGVYVVEDVKSEMTRKLAVYRLKKKMFLHKFRDTNFFFFENVIK